VRFRAPLQEPEGRIFFIYAGWAAKEIACVTYNDRQLQRFLANGMTTTVTAAMGLVCFRFYMVSAKKQS
jgi:hypothetical protein